MPGEINDVLRTRELQIVDSDGNVRAVLKAEDNGTAALVLGDSANGARAILSTDATGAAALVLQSGGGGVFFALNCDGDDSATVMFRDPENRIRASMLLNNDGVTAMLHDLRGKPRLHMTVPAGSGSKVDIVDEDGAVISTLQE